jgi:S-adenosylhomocysteine hydrolase
MEGFQVDTLDPDEIAAKGELLFLTINVNECMNKTAFDNVYGCRHSVPDGIMRSTGMMIDGKAALLAATLMLARVAPSTCVELGLRPYH